jgi:hypothetical protein
MRYTHLSAVVWCILLAGAVSTGDARVRLGASGGISNPLAGLTDDLDGGVAASGHCLLEVTRGFLCGIRIACDYWGIDGESRPPLGKETGVMNARGAFYMMEIMPSLRLTTAEEFSPVNIFGQLGMGCVAITADLKGRGLSGESIRRKPFDRTDARFGLQLGTGVSVGDKSVTVEALPLYHVLFESENLRKRYITFNLGLSFRIP